jgi:site-specific DNA recombinase
MISTLESKSQKRLPITGKAAIYIRVSTDRQSEKGTSLEVQLAECRRYCEQHGLDVIGEFKDVESGLHNGRHQYQQALELAKTQGIEKLVVWRLDRLGRDAHEYLGVLKSLKKAGVDVVSVTQPTESQFMMGMLGLMAEEESRTLSQRITASKQRRFMAGNWSGGPPFGYDVEKKDGGPVLVPNAQAPVVQQLFEMYASGKCALRDLHRYLLGLGIEKTPYAINYILRNRTYLGSLVHGRFSYPPFNPRPEITESKGLHTPLVDEAMFNAVQDRLSRNKNRNRGGVAPKYLFSSLIFCGDCGSRYVAASKHVKDGKRAIVYGCNKRQKGLPCKNHRIYEVRLRDAVLLPLQATLSALSEADVRNAVRAELKREAEAARIANMSAQANLTAAKERLESRLSRLEDMFMDATITKTRYVQRRDQILSELTEIKHRIDESPTPLAGDISGLLVMAESLTVSDLDTVAWRDIIEAVLERIEIKGVAGKRGTAIVVHWKQGFEAVKAAAEAMNTIDKE